MKAEKIDEIIEWVKQEDINPSNFDDWLFLFRDVSDEFLEWELDFDIGDGWDWHYIFCTVYKDVEWKQGYSCVVDRDVVWWFDTPENFAKYVAELYDRAMEILDS